MKKYFYGLLIFVAAHASQLWKPIAITTGMCAMASECKSQGNLALWQVCTTAGSQRWQFRTYTTTPAPNCSTAVDAIWGIGKQWQYVNFDSNLYAGRVYFNQLDSNPSNNISIANMRGVVMSDKYGKMGLAAMDSVMAAFPSMTQFQDSIAAVSSRIANTTANLNAYWDSVKTKSYIASLNYITSSGASVQSVFGRTGVVTASVGDYSSFYKPIAYVPSNSEVISAIGYTPYNDTNPNGYISSVPAQSFASLTGKPTTLSGYGITDAYPLSGNPSNFLTSITSGNVTTALGYTPLRPSNNLSDVASISTSRTNLGLGSFALLNSLAFASLTSIPTTLSGYGITDATSNARSAVSLSFSTTGTSGAATGSYNSSTGVFTVNVPNYTPTTHAPAYPTRSLNTAFQASTTNDMIVVYAVDIACTLSLTTGQTGTVTLEYADDSGITTNVKTVQSTINANTGSLTIGLNLTQTSTASLTGTIPANKWVRIRTTNTVGTPTFTYRSSQETPY